MNKVITAVAAGLALAMLAGAAGAKEWKKVRIATEGGYPPWNQTDASGKLIGFELDLAQDLCKRMKVECEVVAQDWDGIIPALQAGKYDAIMAAMSVTDERKKVIDFSAPYASEPSTFAAAKTSPLLQLKLPEAIDMAQVSPEEEKALNELKAALKGKTLGVQVSTIQQNFAEKMLPDTRVRTYEKIDSVGLDLSSNRLDAILADRSVTESLIKAEGNGNIVIFGPGMTRGLLGEGMGVGLRKKDEDLRKLFSQAIAEANADGTIAKLSTQWFGYDISIKK